MDQIEQKVHEVLLRVGRQRSPTLSKVENGHRLTSELGLTSLDLARIIAILELELGADPFSCQAPITNMRTVGDLCDAYRRAKTAPESEAIAVSFQTIASRAVTQPSAQVGPPNP